MEIYSLVSGFGLDYWTLGTFSSIAKANEWLQKKGIDAEFTEEETSIVWYHNGPWGCSTVYQLDKTVLDEINTEGGYDA